MADEKVYLYINTPLDSSERKFTLINIEGEEEISCLFNYTIVLSANDNAITFQDIIGKQVTVTIETYNQSKRYINGVVTKFIQAGNDYKHTTYFMEIRPWFWELTLTSDSRIFQNKSTPDIIKAIFQELGYTDFSDKLTGSYEQRIYCVQYQETAFDFICRLMQEEGIFYFFEHSDSTHTLILADDNDTFTDCPGSSEIKMKLNSVFDDEKIERLTYEEQLTTNQYSVDDFNFETPETDLMVTTSSGDKKYRRYEYPARFLVKDKGDPISKRRLESFERIKKHLTGNSYCRSFISGYKFTLSEHDRSDLNSSFVLQKVLLRCDQKNYINTFEAFPADLTFKPPITTSKPKIYGSQTALVVGKSGEEIWTDKYGRIKVQFHWDQLGKNDENSSCWIRVAQSWAGKGWGAWFIPRIGMEVVVTFLEGDPDKPLVTGCVYNATQTLPYSLPGNQNISTILSRSTKSGDAGNEIKFDDTKDSELFYMHAQKDMTVDVENERTTTIIESNETLTVKKGDRTIKVETGKELHEVKDTRTVKVTGDETHTNEGNFTHNVKGDYTLSVDGNLTIKVKGSISIKSDMDISTKAGTSIANESGTDFNNKAGTTMENKASISMTCDGGVQLECKASAMAKIDGGGMLEAKGGIIKLN
jgi:type VI secretion system secreted protein VgrG